MGKTSLIMSTCAVLAFATTISTDAPETRPRNPRRYLRWYSQSPLESFFLEDAQVDIRPCTEARDCQATWGYRWRWGESETPAQGDCGAATADTNKA